MAKVVVGTLVRRVVEIVGPRIVRQLVEQRRIEMRLMPQGRIGVFDQPQRGGDHLGVRSGRQSGATHVQRHRPHPLMGIRLHLAALERRQRAMPHIVVEIPDRPARNPVNLVPWPALPQNRLEHPTQKQTVAQRTLILVEQQIAVKLEVARHDVRHHQPQHALRLSRVGERR